VKSLQLRYLPFISVFEHFGLDPAESSLATHPESEDLTSPELISYVVMGINYWNFCLPMAVCFATSLVVGR